jgi:hypothetical protein
MDNKTKWSLAAKYGLILSSATIIVSIIGMFNIPGWLGTILTIAKFVAIFYMLRYFMEKYSEMYDGSVSYGTSFKFGFLVCFCSTIICTAYTYIDYTVFRPEVIELMIETMLTAQNSMGATSSVVFDYQMLSSMMPKVLIFSLFLDYIIFALIFPAIVANFTKKEDIFDINTDTQE